MIRGCAGSADLTACCSATVTALPTWLPIHVRHACGTAWTSSQGIQKLATGACARQALPSTSNRFGNNGSTIMAEQRSNLVEPRRSLLHSHIATALQGTAMQHLACTAITLVTVQVDNRLMLPCQCQSKHASCSDHCSHDPGCEPSHGPTNPATLGPAVGCVPNRQQTTTDPKHPRCSAVRSLQESIGLNQYTCTGCKQYVKVKQHDVCVRMGQNCAWGTAQCPSGAASWQCCGGLGSSSLAHSHAYAQNH